MEMSPLQIASEYRTAKNKSKQIGVLAELNACTQRQIAQILQEQGEELPGHWKEKLTKGLKTKPVSDRYLRESIVEAVTPDTSSGAAAPPRSALLSPGKPVPDSFPDGESPQGEGRSAALSPDRDPASRAGGISWPQYSRLQNLLGRLEGVGCALPNDVAIYYFDTIDLLNALADEIKPEVRE